MQPADLVASEERVCGVIGESDIAIEVCQQERIGQEVGGLAPYGIEALGSAAGVAVGERHGVDERRREDDAQAGGGERQADGAFYDEQRDDSCGEGEDDQMAGEAS